MVVAANWPLYAEQKTPLMKKIDASEEEIYMGNSSPRQRDFRLNYISKDLLSKLEKDNSILIHVLSYPRDGIYIKKIHTDRLKDVMEHLVNELDYPLETEYPTVRVISWNHAMLVWAEQLMNIKAKEFRLPNLVIHHGESQDEKIHAGDIIIFE
jgi:hypothetical protein